MSFSVPGSTSTTARGINNLGEIVGFYDASGNTGCGFGVNCAIHGFKLINGKFTRVDIPGALQTEIYGVNDGGDLVGSYFTSDNTVHGFLLMHTGQLRHIDRPGTHFTLANGVNNSLTVVGDSNDANAGFIWKNGVFTTLNITVPGNGESQTLLGISNNGFISGTLFRADNFHGFQKTGSDLDIFSNFNDNDIRVMGVNARDDLVGQAPTFNDNAGFVAFHQESTETNENSEPPLKIVLLRFPGAVITTASSINYNQSIVGNYIDSAQRSHGFLAVH